MGAVLRLHLQEVLAVEHHRPLRHLIKWVSHEHRAERGLTGAVGAHYGMCLAVVDDEVYATEYFFAAYAGV